MTDLSDPLRNHRHMSPDQPWDLNTRRSPSPATHTAAMPTHVHGRTPPPHATNSGQPPAELIAHLVIALSRYQRQLRAESGRVPPQIEDLITFLADRVRVRHDVPMLHPWRASDTSAMPRRLLITKSDAAEQLGVSLRTIERLISAGRLPLVHVEGAARVRVSDLKAYVHGLEPDGGSNPAPAD
jgi:excisionase family DNA binding protein